MAGLRGQAPRQIAGARKTAGAGQGGPAKPQAFGRTRRVSAIVAFMQTGAVTVALWPRWMDSVAEMLRMNALVRTRCATCETLLCVEIEDVVARHGAIHSLADKLERCRMVGCIGSAFCVTSRSDGGAWTTLLRDAALVDSFQTLTPGRSALV